MVRDVYQTDKRFRRMTIACWFSAGRGMTEYSITCCCLLIMMMMDDGVLAMDMINGDHTCMGASVYVLLLQRWVGRCRVKNMTSCLVLTCLY